MADLLAGQKIIQRVIKRLHVGIDLVLHVAGQIAQLLARLNGRARQDDLVHMPADQHVHADSHRQIGLARTRRADAKGQFIVEQRLHISLLRVGARLDQLLAGLDLDPLGFAFEQLDLVALACGIEHRLGTHAQFAVDITRFQRPPGLKPAVKRLQDLGGLMARVRFANHGKLIAAAQDLHAKSVFDGGQVAVVFTAKVDQQKVVREFQQGFSRSFARRGQGTGGQSALLFVYI